MVDGFMNQCYQIIDGELVLDEEKHKAFLEQLKTENLLN